MMIDTGASMTLVTEAWARAHKLKITPKHLTIRGADNKSIAMLGVTKMTVQLTPTLEMDVDSVAVCEG